MFVHLHTHSEFSPLDGMVKVRDAFAAAAADGQPALAITDHGNLAAAWSAQSAADEAGVKFIAGMEAYLAIGSRTGRDVVWVPADDDSADEGAERVTAAEGAGSPADETRAGMKSRPYHHITLLATTPQGWRNLVALNNESYRHVFHKPRIDLELLAAHAEGLIVLTGCLGGPVMGPLAHGDVDGARAGLASLIDAVGAGNVYVELMEHGVAAESAAMPALVELARGAGVGIVATNDAHYPRADQAEAHAAWLLVQSKSTLADPKFSFHGEGYHMRSEAEMRALRPEPWWQEACDTTAAIAERCEQRTLPTPSNLMPRFPIPEGFESNRAYLTSLLMAGAERLYGAGWREDQELRDRVNSEVRVITDAGMIDYFLVVHDLVSWARSDAPARPGEATKKPILVGPGRGSAGGSEIAYLLGITLVPPRPYGLLFERFYEAGRAEPPDIDIDFPQGRRQEVIQYLRDRWGAENVASIGTFMVSRSKAALKSAARVLGLPAVGSKLADAVPSVEAKPMPMAQLLDDTNPATAEYRRRLASVEGADRVHDFAAAFEDVVSGFSIHASGVIVSAEPLHTLVPMRANSTGWVLQWTGPEAEAFGLLKIDVLGLRNLDIIEQAAEYIQQQTGEVVDPLDLPHPDHPDEARRHRVDAAWKIIAEGRTAGLFQLESPKMTELAMQIAPRCLDDVSALVALYRPGPMTAGMHTDFAARRRGEEPVDYRVFTTDPDEQAELATVLGETYGVWVFQEQLMRLGTVVSGFDAEQRSTLRKAVSKKKADVMAKVGTMFREGAVREIRDESGAVVKRAFSPTTADALWDAMLGSASYLFNKAHSTTYGYLAYMTAYFKANWPAAYAAATLAVTDGHDKRLQVLSALHREGVTVLPPDVNATNPRTAPEGEHSIRFGLTEVRAVGQVGELIAAERNRGGEYTSLRDVFLRVQKPDAAGSAITVAHLRALIESGAADRFGTRAGLMAVVGTVPTTHIDPPALNWGAVETSSRQRTALLTPLGEHPLVTLRDQLGGLTLPTRAGGGMFPDRKPIGVGRIPDEDGAYVEVLGVLAGWSEKPYSKGRLANLVLEGSTSSIQGTMWNDQLEQLLVEGAVPTVGDVVIVSGRVRFRSILSDPSDEDSEEVSVKELSVNALTRVEVHDPRTGSWPPLPEHLPMRRFERRIAEPKAPRTSVRATPATTAGGASDAPVAAPAPAAAASPAAATAATATMTEPSTLEPVAVVSAKEPVDDLFEPSEPVTHVPGKVTEEHPSAVAVADLRVVDAEVAQHAVIAAGDGVVVHRDPVVLPSQRLVTIRPWGGVADALAEVVVVGPMSARHLHARIGPAYAKAVADAVTAKLADGTMPALATVEVGEHAFHLRIGPLGQGARTAKAEPGIRTAGLDRFETMFR